MSGRALILDGTIEHEAWKPSRQVRVVLLFELGRLELSADKRVPISAVGDYGDDSPD